MRHAGSRRVVAALVVAGAAAGACSGGDGDGGGKRSATSSDIAASTAAPTTHKAGISEEEAIASARSAIAAEYPELDLDATRAHVSETAGAYDVSFVPVDLAGPSGEPHAVVDRQTGEVLDTYRTR